MPRTKTIGKKYQPPKVVLEEHKEFLTKIGLALQKLRNQKELSILSLCKETGLSRNSYSQMEKGLIYFSLLNLLTVLHYHNCSPEDFFKSL